MKYLFGPVNSRRLGRSLGIDLIPTKICSFDCIYCEVGAKRLITGVRKEYAPLAAVLAEVDRYLAQPDAAELFDLLTITASGEPTLHTGIGRLIEALHERSDKPVAVLTNGSLLSDPTYAAIWQGPTWSYLLWMRRAKQATERSTGPMPISPSTG